MAATKLLDESKYISVAEIAKDLRRSKRTVERWCQTGKLDCFQFFGRFLVERSYYLTWRSERMLKKEIR